ncbi:MAG: hypothetical protein AB8F34_02770 [Akkermansiaceae bacterium]
MTVLVALMSDMYAAGITGRVSDSKNRSKAKVKVTIKYGSQTQYTYTDSNGRYVLEIPTTYAGVRGKIYASGTYVTRCTIPKKDYNVVNVRLK